MKFNKTVRTINQLINKQKIKNDKCIPFIKYYRKNSIHIIYTTVNQQPIYVGQHEERKENSNTQGHSQFYMQELAEFRVDNISSAQYLYKYKQINIRK